MSSQEPLSQFQPNLAQSIPWSRGFKFAQMKDPTIFQGELIKKLQKIHGQILKIFYSRTSVLISTKLCTNYSSVKENADCINEGPHPFQRGDSNEGPGRFP